MSAETLTPSLFPEPKIPAAAAGELVMAHTASILAHRKLGEALTRDAAKWHPDAVVEVGQLIAATKAIQERTHALLMPPEGKR
jgi:hypothetical protein